MKIKFYNIDEDTIIRNTMLAPWDYDIKTDTSEVTILDIHPSCVNETLFIDLDEANINYEIMCDGKEPDYASALEALRESIATISESLRASMSSTTYDALKAFAEGVKGCGE